MSGLNPQKVQELKVLLDQIIADSSLLHQPDFIFLKKFIEHFGGRIPVKKESKPETHSTHQEHSHEGHAHSHGGHSHEGHAHSHEGHAHSHEGHAHPHVHEEEEEVPEPFKEEKEEADPDLLPLDNDPPLESGDPNAPVSEENIEKANSKKMEAMEAQREGKLEGSVKLFTEALKANPRSGILYANRAAVLLLLKKPNAAIRDCDTAIKISPDSAKPYKVRGKALRLIGEYERALRDVQVGQKLDWDDASHKLENELKPRVEKIIERRKHREEYEKNKKPSKGTKPSPPPGGFAVPPEMKLPPGLSPEMLQAFMSDPEVMAAMSDPATLAKIQEIMRDPSAAPRYQNDPSLKHLFQKFGVPGQGKK